jgi:hypothetical protein
MKSRLQNCKEEETYICLGFIESFWRKKHYHGPFLGLTLSWTFSYFLTHKAHFILFFFFLIIFSYLLKIIIVFFIKYIK